MNIEIRIPFVGFYESRHSGEIDRELELFVDQLQREGADEALLSTLWEYIDYQKTEADYIKKYLRLYLHALESESGITFTPVSEVEMSSPREYNFETNRLFVKLPLSQLRCLLTKTVKDKEKLKLFKQHIKDSFTSRDGFMSYYSNELRAWGRCSKWDHNQWCTLLEVWKEDDGDFYSMPDYVDVDLIFTDEGNELLSHIKQDLEKLSQWCALTK